MPTLANPRREIFAQGLAKGLEPEAAYVKAGFAPHRQNAHRMMTADDIKARVAELLSRSAERAVVTRQRTIEELAKIGFSDIRRAVRWRSGVVVAAMPKGPAGEATTVVNEVALLNEVVLLDSDKIDDATAAAIAEISQTKDGAIKIKFHDKRAALMDMAKLEGWVIERSEVGKPGDFSRMTDDELDRYIAQQQGTPGLGHSREALSAAARNPRAGRRPH